MAYNPNYISYNKRYYAIMRDVYQHALTSDAPLATATPTLKVPLHRHQQAALHAMEQHERQLMQGMDCSGEKLYSSYGILGDSVGVGKSLMVLGHIARLGSLPALPSRFSLGAGSTGSAFSVKEHTFSDLSEAAGSIIVVPHTLFRQWANYITTQTTLRAMLLDKRRMFESPTFIQDLLAADVTLISNTFYKDMLMIQRAHNIQWKRLFIDEADTIKIPYSDCKLLASRFTWLVTASWANILFPNDIYVISRSELDYYSKLNRGEYAALGPFFADILKSQTSINTNYTRMSYGLTSTGFFNDVILNRTHILRGRLVVKCSDELVRESISLPPLYRHIVLCKKSQAHRIVANVVSEDVMNLLHGGDVKGAMEALGVKTEDVGSIVEAVTTKLQKDLDRLKATYVFKSGLEYATAAAKEYALDSLKARISRAEESIKSVEARIAEAAKESCPICYEDAGVESAVLLTPCCSRSFCAQCILTCLNRSAACPMCRAPIAAADLVRVVPLKEKNAIVESGSAAAAAAAAAAPEELKKEEALLKLLEENPQGRFLVFSRYDNPFEEIQTQIQALGVKVKHLRGNKDVINSTLGAFQRGELRALLLNSDYAGAGLNITDATHVVLLHAMTHEEEKQILGRAYRLGRTEPLQFIKLLHNDEIPVMDVASATSALDP
jgi:hypothetical protein